MNESEKGLLGKNTSRTFLVLFWFFGAKTVTLSATSLPVKHLTRSFFGSTVGSFFFLLQTRYQVHTTSNRIPVHSAFQSVQPSSESVLPPCSWSLPNHGARANALNPIPPPPSPRGCPHKSLPAAKKLRCARIISAFRSRPNAPYQKSEL